MVTIRSNNPWFNNEVKELKRRVRRKEKILEEIQGRTSMVCPKNSMERIQISTKKI